MSVADKVSVNTHYTRSINLERDADSISVVASYIPTSRALRTLEQILDSLKEDESPRAWSLVGPYGSGKSSFAVFISHLLGDPRYDATIVARKVLENSNPALAAKLRTLCESHEGSAGYCTVSLTGRPESLSKRIINNLAETAEEIWRKRRGRRNAIVHKLANLAEQKTPPSTTEVLESIKEFQEALSKIKYDGLMLVIDELGKFLEYEARHYGANDIYLLQALAEHALSFHRTKFSLVVLLHQSIDKYAQDLGKSLKEEWAKIQGRFETVPFIESAEQTLRIVAAAIEHEFDKKESEKILKYAKRAARVLEKGKALPGTMDETTAAELFSQCYPLHPLSSLLLPLLCQRVAQNERTLFSYLGSREAYGFQEGMERCKQVGDWIYPWEIYEYFIQSQPAMLSDHGTRRRWAEVVSATERLGDAPLQEGELLKTVGLLNIIGAKGNFKASKQIVEFCLPTKAAVRDTLDRLCKKSLLQYRKFSAEYRVWQGSDFDLDAHVEEERSKLGRFPLAEKLNSRHSLLPIVARRHTIEKGTLRYFTPIFIDAGSYRQHPKQNDQARIIFFLAESKDDEDCFQDSVRGYFSDLDITVLCFNGEQLREGVGEVLALEEVQKKSQVLNSDPVAQREFKDRFVAAGAKEDELLARLTDEPAQSLWSWKSDRLSIRSKRALQETLSSTLDMIYYAAPIIKNELINRDKPSAQANAGRNKLVVAMLKNESEEDLGFDKYPSEKAIYRALLRETRLHVKGKDGQWRFQGPPKRNRYNLHPVWKRIEGFLDGTEQKPQSLIELNQELLAPPYGVKAGVLPILYLTALIADKNELAVYENRRYAPYLTEEQVERFLKRPDEFTLQRFRIRGLNHTIFQEYSKTLFGDEKGRSLLSLARPIAEFMGELSEYTKTTKRGVSKKAQDVRDAFKLAKSPVHLLMEDIPRALDINLKKAHRDGEEVKSLSKRLTEVLRELKHCCAGLQEELRVLLAQAFGLDKETNISELRHTLYGRCAGLESYTIDRDGQRAFILRLINNVGSDAQWFNNILMFLGHKPLEKWNDTDRDTAEYRLTKFTRKLNDLEKLRIHYDSFDHNRDDDFEVYLLRSIKKGAPDYDEIIAVDKKRHEVISKVKTGIKERLKELGDQDLELAALAEVVDEVLAERHENSGKANETFKEGRRLRNVN